MGRLKRIFQILKSEKLVVWSNLSRFGNSPLAKAALLAPIVAIFVQLNDVYLAQTFGFQNAIWLYWSLISIGVGQILFSLKCPKSIRIYGNDQERFVLEAKASWTMNQLEAAKKDKVLHFIGPNGLLQIDQEILELSDRKSVEAYWANKSKRLDEESKSDFVRGISVLQQMLKTDMNSPNNYSAASAIILIITNFPDSIRLRQGDRDKDAVLGDLKHFAFQIREKRHVIGPDNRDTAWVIPALNCRYELENRDGRAFRWAVAGFYVSGFLYFAWRALASLGSMTDATIKAIF